jgi:hypothetical protein
MSQGFQTPDNGPLEGIRVKKGKKETDGHEKEKMHLCNYKRQYK